MPTWLGRFNQEHPGIDLSILEISWTDIETGLEEGQMDVGSGLEGQCPGGLDPHAVAPPGPRQELTP
jgi:DNA-binding transcriptional LysR family regulator